MSTYKIVDAGDRKAIRCLVCGMTSYSGDDVYNKYCGNCHEYHPIKKPEPEKKQTTADVMKDSLKKGR